MHFNRLLSEAIDDIIGDSDVAKDILLQNQPDTKMQDEIKSLDDESNEADDVTQDIEDIYAKLAEIDKVLGVTQEPQQPSASIVGDIV